tara:strand:+ start:83 stop:1213 length:1131 start_codon:yes stop_codon:yes gene_type:complete
MGALKNIGIDLDGGFVEMFIKAIEEGIRAAKKPEIAFLDLTFGFDVEIPTGEKAEVAADGFIEQASKDDSAFKSIFIPAVKPIFSIIDAIPAVNVLSAVGVSDPTAALLPVLNNLTDILADVGIPNPNEFLLTKLPEVLDRSKELIDELEKLAKNIDNLDAVTKAAEKIAEVFGEIIPELNIDDVKAKILESAEKIAEGFNIEIPEIPEIPDITDPISFFNIEIPDLEFISPEEIIAFLFNFELDVPPIGVIFTEMLKIKLDMLREIALASTPAGIADPPDILIAAIEEAKKILTGGFSIPNFLRALADSIFGKFFNELEKNEKIKNLLKDSATLISALHQTILTLVGSLVVTVVGILFGEGLIMKSAAIGLGILK